MAYDERYGGRGYRGEGRYEQGRDDRDRDGRQDERGFFERVGDWFAGDEGRSERDRDPGAHADYYRGGNYPRQRFGPEGSFESRGDFRRSNRYAESGQAGYGGRGGYERSRGFSRDADTSGTFGNRQGYVEQGYSGSGDYGGVRPDRTYGETGVPNYGEQSWGGSGSNYARDRMIMDQYNRNRQQEHSRSSGQYGDTRSRHDHDPHYAEWRNRQIDALDRDYDDYRRENATRFDNEFGSWRETRQGQRQSLSRVTEHMEVVGSDDQHLGKVDKVRGDRIVLTKSDPSAGGHHHSVPVAWIDRVDGKVILNRTAEAARKSWRDEETSRALFEREDSGSDGPHILGRSFSGTYRGER